MHTMRILFLCGILIILPQWSQCRKDARKIRAIDFPMQWRPVQMAPSAAALHVMPGDQHLISITNFDGTNKAQLAQIAHHNAQILRHIKRLPGVPVTQYHNPFPMFGTAIGGNVATVVSTASGSGESHAQQTHQLHHPHHHQAAGGHGGGVPGPSKHFIVQTSNVVVHPPPPSPPPPAAVALLAASITSAPLVHPHPNSLLTSSSNMAQTMVPFGGGGAGGQHYHKHQYFGAKHPPAFLLSGKPLSADGQSIGNGGGGGAFKFLNAIHPSTTTTASGAKTGYATAALIKGGAAVSMQPFYSSTTSRIPIIRDSTQLTPITFHRHTTVKPHPVVGKLQTHLAIGGTRPKGPPGLPPSGPSGPHTIDELSAHQSHLISSLAQFGAPNFVRGATGADAQQKLPRPNQGPPFVAHGAGGGGDHGTPHYHGKNYGSQLRFPAVAVVQSANPAFSVQQQQQHQQQQQQHHMRAQILQQQHHQQKLQHQQQQQQQVQQEQLRLQLQHEQQQQQQQREQHQQQQQQQQQQQELHQYHQQQQLHFQQQQQNNAAQQNAYNNQQHQHQQQQHQQQSQQEETFYAAPATTTAGSYPNASKPAYEPHQSLEQILREFNVPFKQMPPLGETASTREPHAYQQPPSASLPSIEPSVLSPFFQQIQQQQHKNEHSTKYSSNSNNNADYANNDSADRLPHFFISSTFAPSPPLSQFQPTAVVDDYLPHNLSFHDAFPSDAITYHHQHIDTSHSQQHVPTFNRIEDEYTMNLVPPPSYAKDTSQFRRPQPSRGPPSTAYPHLQQQPQHPQQPQHHQHHQQQQQQHQHSASESGGAAAAAAADQIKALDILNKYNIPAISPLQDANRFAYNAVNPSQSIGHHHHPVTISSSLAPPTPSPAARPAHHDLPQPSSTLLAHFTTDKPNVFRNLNRPPESEYKQHKLMHPSYTGGAPKRPAAAANHTNHHNATHHKPEAVTAGPASATGSGAVTHSFFTIEDAVTLSPQLNHVHHNRVRPTAIDNQIEAHLNRPHEEEITEVITMRATSEDDDLLQHLDATSTTPAAPPARPPAHRPKHRRRRPRPSSTSTSTERRPTASDEENNNSSSSNNDNADADDENDDHHHQPPDYYPVRNPAEQGHWETKRFPTNHRETPIPPAEPTASSTRSTAAAPPPAQPNAPRQRTRTRGGGRPTVTVLQPDAGGIVLEKPTRARRPSTQRPSEEPAAAASPTASSTTARTRATSSYATAARTTTSSSVETTNNYDEPTTMNFRDNIFLANLKHRRRPPHSTKATAFASSSLPPPSPTTHVTESMHYDASNNNRYQQQQQQPQTTAGGYVTEIGEDTFMTTRPTRPSVTQHHQPQHTTHPAASNEIHSLFDFEEIPSASDIAQTVTTQQVTIAPTTVMIAGNDEVDTTPVEATVPWNSSPSTTTSTTTTTATIPLTEPAAIAPTNHQTLMPVVEYPAADSSPSPSPSPVSPGHSHHHHRHRHRQRPKDHQHTKYISQNEIHPSSSTTSSSTTTTLHAETNSDVERDATMIVPTKFSAHPVHARLPNMRTTHSLPTQDPTTTTRTTDQSIEDVPLPPPNKHHRLNTVIQKFDPKNRPRFSVKEYRPRNSTPPSTPTQSETPTQTPTTPASTTRLRYPTRSRVLPDLRIKTSRTTSTSKQNMLAASSEESTSTSASAERHHHNYDEPISVASSSTTTTEETEPARKRFVPKDRRNKSTASNEIYSSSERSGGYTFTTPPSSVAFPSSRERSTTTTVAPAATSARTTRTRNPSSRRGGGGGSTSTTGAPSEEFSRAPMIRKYPSGPPLRRPSQPSLRQRIAIGQQKKSSSTEANSMAPSTQAATLAAALADSPSTTTPASINKLFNVDESDNGVVADLNVDDIDMSDSVNTENYKLETAIMKIAKDDHSYRPYAHSSHSTRSRSRSSSGAASSTTEAMLFLDGLDAGGDQHEAGADNIGVLDAGGIDFAPNQLNDVHVDMNGSPSEQSERVADLTRFGTNTFQSVNTAVGSGTSRRIPGYFTLATEDPILPIEAFFPKMGNGNSMRG